MATEEAWAVTEAEAVKEVAAADTTTRVEVKASIQETKILREQTTWVNSNNIAITNQ